MDIIAITISVNYSDILEHMLEQNSKILHKWFIVTTTADTKTITLLEKYKHTDKIHILRNVVGEICGVSCNFIKNLL